MSFFNEETKTKKKMSWKKKLLIASPFFIIAIIMMSQDAQISDEEIRDIHGITTSLEWNTENLNINENGNLKVAVEKLKEINNIKSQAESVNPAILAKRTWEFIGKVVEVSGTVTSVQDYPPKHDISNAFGTDTSCEIVFMSDDLLFFVFFGNSSSGNKTTGDAVTVYGYPAGIIEAKNRMGGKTEHIVIVGNAFN